MQSIFHAQRAFHTVTVFHKSAFCGFISFERLAFLNTHFPVLTHDLRRWYVRPPPRPLLNRIPLGNRPLKRNARQAFAHIERIFPDTRHILTYRHTRQAIVFIERIFISVMPLGNVNAVSLPLYPINILSSPSV